MVTAIFPAAGQGKRMGAGMNKVFMELDGTSVLVRTLLRFSACGAVDNLVVVVAEEELALAADMLEGVSGLKPWRLAAGGSERQYSVWNGIQAIEGAGDGDIILVHDAARPFVPAATILAIISAAREKGAAIAAVPVKNTIKLCNQDGEVTDTPDRRLLWEVQTPQGFRRSILVRANQQAAADGFLGTDDAGLVERLGEKVYIVQSDYRNIKLTTPEDMVVARAFLAEEAGL